MKALGTGAVIAMGGFALLLTAAPITFDLGKGGFAVKSADARFLKGGSSQRPGGVVNPADPGGNPPVVQVPNPKGGGGVGGGGSGGGGKSK
jgi:hypothetical protein